MSQQTASAKKLSLSPSVLKRSIERIEVRESEGMTASIQLTDDLTLHHIPIYDLSINGIGLVISKKYAGKIEIGKKVKVCIICSWGYNFEGLYSCARISEQPNHLRLGLKNYSPTVVSDFQPDINHSTDLLPIPHDLPVVGYLYKDFFYVERVAFKIEQISSRQITILINDTELLLFPGMQVELMLAIHTTSGRNINGIVSQAVVSTNKTIHATISVTNLPKELEFDVVNHLLQNRTVTPSALRTAGFTVTAIANNFRFRYVKSHQEYMEVLQLRKTAYAKAGKVSEDADLEKLIAPLDSISRILIACHGEKIVASAALSFPIDDTTLLDTERALPDGYPKEFPPKNQVVEIARLCTSPDYRKGDLAVRMFEQMYRVFMTSGRSFLITSCDDKLWEVYKKIGWKKAGYSYPHPYLSGVVHHIITMDRKGPSTSKGMNILRWNHTYRNMTEFLDLRLDLQLTWMEKVKVKIFIFIGKILRIRVKDRY